MSLEQLAHLYALNDVSINFHFLIVLVCCSDGYDSFFYDSP